MVFDLVLLPASAVSERHIQGLQSIYLIAIMRKMTIESLGPHSHQETGLAHSTSQFCGPQQNCILLANINYDHLFGTNYPNKILTLQLKYDNQATIFSVKDLCDQGSIHDPGNLYRARETCLIGSNSGKSSFQKLFLFPCNHPFSKISSILFRGGYDRFTCLKASVLNNVARGMGK